MEMKRRIDLQLFSNTQTTLKNTPSTYDPMGRVVTPGNDMSYEMKTFYSDYLIDNAVPNLVHDQFGQKHPIPKNGGKRIEFRKYDPFPKATTEITEGVTPNGHNLSVSVVIADVKQYGDYVELSDVLLLTAIDNNMVQATKLLGNQAGETLDWVTREELNKGTNVMFAKGTAQSRPASRAAVGTANTLSVEDIFNAARILKNFNAKKINGSYVGIVCPDIAYTLMRDDEWIDASKYAGSTQIFEGEIGKIAGVRFVETTEAKVFEGAGASSIDVYSTLILGENAYGVTEIAGGGLQHIVKQLGSSGSADPLNQRATVGWKAIKTAEILVQGFMLRIESAAAV